LIYIISIFSINKVLIKILDADEMTAKQLVETAKQVQDESKASTARTKQVLQTTVQIGSETSETLKHQTEQLGNVDQTMDVIENNLKRADKQIR
jgi:SNARE protein